MTQIAKMQEELAQELFSEPYHLCSDYEQSKVDRAVEVAKFYLSGEDRQNSLFREYEEARDRFQEVTDKLVKEGVLARGGEEWGHGFDVPSTVARRVFGVVLKYTPDEASVNEAAEIIREAMLKAAIKREFHD